MDWAMSKLSREERLQIMLTGKELRALDDWRFAKRMPSRASAVRELLRRGLAAEGFDVAEEGSKSEDFGMIDAAQPTLKESKKGS
jgi:predicted nucleotidyltransferase